MKYFFSSSPFAFPQWRRGINSPPRAALHTLSRDLTSVMVNSKLFSSLGMNKYPLNKQRGMTSLLYLFFNPSFFGENRFTLKSGALRRKYIYAGCSFRGVESNFGFQGKAKRDRRPVRVFFGQAELGLLGQNHKRFLTCL